MNSRYYLHRIALLPLLPNAVRNDIASVFERLRRIDEGRFLNFLQQQGLASMWDKMLESRDDEARVSSAFRSSLHQMRLRNTGAYLLQRHTLQQIRQILDQAEIPHVVFKGADIRERLYDEPAIRPAADIDVLVEDTHKHAAIKAFKAQGFTLHASATIVSHEVSLRKGDRSIDLHWDILRPGRTRNSMVEALLASRVDYQSHWGMSNEAALFVMLVHPVFAKYSTSVNAALMRNVDLARMLDNQSINWPQLIDLLLMSGLNTAAWTSLQWLQIVSGIQPPEALISAIRPGPARRKYLRTWLQQNLSSALLPTPLLIQLGLTLPAHDRFSDARRAVRRARQLKRSEQQDLENLLNKCK